jgi:hypothetical protein
MDNAETRLMGKWEYCWVRFVEESEEDYADINFCTTSGVETVDAHRSLAATAAQLGEEGWEAFAVDASRERMWFKRRK